MRTLKLIVFGALALLAVLRGIELAVAGEAVSRVIFPIALGLACLALFIRAWKSCPPAGS